MKNTKVYLMSTENVKDPRTFALWKEFLPKEHWEKTVRPLKEEDRKTELAAWFLLYQALREWGISEEKINADGAYYYGEHGKPMRRNEEICFNLSHSGKYVLCAVSDMEIGCVIEKIKEVKWKLANSFFSDIEYDFLVRLGSHEILLKLGETVKSGKTDKQEKVGKQQNINRQKEKGKIKENAYTVEEAFTRFWVLRESYVKKTGEGLGAALTGLDFSDILGQKNSKGKKNGEFLEETFFEMEYDGYRIAICGEKDSKPEFVVYRGTIDNCFL